MFSKPNPQSLKKNLTVLRSPPTIGTRFETSLHRELKLRYVGQNGQAEAEVDGFVVDGISADGEFIEIQTGSFGPLKKKIQKLILLGKFRVIYPVIVTKYLDVFDSDGVRQYRRKSNRRGSVWDLFYALVYAPDLPLIHGLNIELALVDAAERRVRDGKGSWRRQGLSIHDRQMLALHECICLKNPSDYLRFIPFTTKEPFTSSMLAEKTGIRKNLARKTLYVLTNIGIVQMIGKQGNAFVYQAVSSKKG